MQVNGSNGSVTGQPVDNFSVGAWIQQTACATVPSWLQGPYTVTVWAEVDSDSSSVSARFDDVTLNGNNLLFAEDSLGTTRVITDVNGVVCYDADFYPYGGERPYTNTCDPVYKFEGKERDPESGLDNFGARFNASSMGRFMSPDPDNAGAFLDPPQSWNAYSYVLNNPLNATDPSGLTCVDASTGPADNGDGQGCEAAGVAPGNPLDWSKITPDTAYVIAQGPSYEPDGSILSQMANPATCPNCMAPRTTAANVMNDPRTYVAWYGASALGGYGLYAAGAFEGGFTTLGLEGGAQSETALTGQIHHGISRTIQRALQRNPNLRNIYKARDSRFITQAKDLASHNGYQAWHRELDRQVVRWIETHQTASPVEFENFLKELYRTADLLSRFPKGFQ